MDGNNLFKESETPLKYSKGGNEKGRIALGSLSLKLEIHCY